MFQLALIRNILYDKIGEFLTDELLKIDGFPESILDAIVKEGKKNPESLWFDQFKTRKIAETFSQLIGLSYYDAIFFLNRRQGPHLKDWIWGNNHKLFLHHPFEKSLLGKYIFPKGPFAVAGFSTSIFSTASLPFNEREISLAPSARIIHTGWDDPLKINLVSGQSGISSSKHYFDLGNLWLNGEYTKMEKNQESMTQKNLKLLRLKVHIK
jgi:penicillin amidase